MSDINISWTVFKGFVNTKNLLIQYIDATSVYYLFAFDNQFSISCVIAQDGGADVMDFETNYKPSANQKIENDTRNATLSGKTFIATTDLINIGTSQTAFYLLKNPVASSKSLRLDKIILGLGSNAGTFRIYRAPTITSNGTALTISNKHIQTSPTATVMQAFSQPTISANGTLLRPVSLTTSIGQVELNYEGLFILEAGFNLLITAQNSQNNSPTYVTCEWIEI